MSNLALIDSLLADQDAVKFLSTVSKVSIVVVYDLCQEYGDKSKQFVEKGVKLIHENTTLANKLNAEEDKNV